MSALFGIPGYAVKEVVHEGIDTIVYRGTSQTNQQPVILKVLKADYPSLEQIFRLKHEYKIRENLNLAGVVKVYRIEDYEHRLVMVCEDFGGISLKQWLSTHKPSLLCFLNIAVSLARTIDSLHQYHIVHKDIKPANIIINPQSEQVKLTDFGIASRLDKETPQITNPNHMEGTLAYMSPEQTGRMNRCVDYRSDFYALGVTFYEILTEKLPFQSHEALELIHYHIAKQATPIQQLNPEVPEVLAAIIAKLMAKNAENRYQTAAGLLADLELCLEQLKTQGTISKFIPGERDRTANLLIPQKLYGREKEVFMLLSAFERVAASQSKIELVLVSGYSGIGKSSLVNEVHKPIVRQRGYFIRGKFDQFQRNIPYASLIQALQSLIQQLLTETNAQLELWKQKLLSALNGNGQVIIDVIPEVERIIGKQPLIPQLGLKEAQNRFNQVFQSFIQVFTQREHPLTIFLDDLQWADSASLDFIQVLMTNPDTQYLLLIGAYRDNEVTGSHPLLKTLEEISQAGTVIKNIVLYALELKHIQQILADTLNDGKTSLSLAELLFNKTQGNPFFFTQLLKTLHQDQLLKFDFAQGCWQWDLQHIQATGIADKSVVELVAGNIAKLPETTQNTLKLAACIGARFSLNILATVSEQRSLFVAAALEPALQAGLILPLSNEYNIPLLFADEELDMMGFDNSQITYRFLHDRVQQAAYSLILESQKQATHFKIGQLLLQSKSKSEIESRIFDIVNQFNYAIDLFSTQPQKDELAQLNLTAGHKAKASAAHEAAVSYLRIARELLAENCWQYQYNLSLDIYVEGAEAEYLTTNFELAQKLSDIVIQQAVNLLDLVKVYELIIDMNIAQTQQFQAVKVGIKAVEMLGIYLVSYTGDRHSLPQLPLLSDLATFPEMTDPCHLASIRILSKISAAAYQSAPDIYPQIVLTMVNLCLEHGHSSLASYVYGAYTAFLQSIIGDPAAAYHSGQIAFSLLEQYPAKELEVKVYMVVATYALPGKEHIKSTFNPLIKGIHSGLEVGNITHAGLTVIAYCTQLFLSGENLELVNNRQHQYIDLLRKLKQQPYVRYARIWGQLVLNLQGAVAKTCDLIGEIFDETNIVSWFEQPKYYQGLFAAYIAKLMILYIFSEYEQAINYSKKAAPYQRATLGIILLSVYYFYYSLALLANYTQIEVDKQSQLLEQVQANQEKLKHWANHAPCNFQHKYDLVAAEIARVQGEVLAAMNLYDSAIAGAGENGYIQEESLANERAALFYLDLGKTKIAKTYMTEAYYGYIKWGAIAKVTDLEKRYADLIPRTQVIGKSNQGIIDDWLTSITALQNITRITNNNNTNNILDWGTVMKAAEAISSEIILDNLLRKLLHILLENTASQKGCLILEQDGELFIKAIDKEQNNSLIIMQSTPVESSVDVPVSLINYVARTQQALILGNASQENIASTDPYILQHQPKSVLCTPILYQGKLIGIIYLENNLTTDAYTSDRLEILKLLSTQAAIAIENASLYAREQEKAQQLQQSLEKLQRTQAQLVQTEKISSLGQLVAGVAHEVNNPVGFISGSLCNAKQYIADLFAHLNLYQQHYSNPPTIIQEHGEEIEIEYLLADLPKMIDSMQLGSDRIQDIMQSLRNYSRNDNGQRKLSDVHKGIDTTLMILQHRLKAKSHRPAIQVIKNYGNLPQIPCYLGQLNQVFMNLLANAIDALDASNEGKKYHDLEQQPNIIHIQTTVEDEYAVIRIADNGLGISQEVQQLIFNPFFTTKAEGKGTGLGLSISHQIITEKHGGTLECNSSPGQGTEFVIRLPLD
ncbi:multi-sensor signal transduction multi-kinase [Calothrix sp. NIES-2100]|uniref:trifunctional serine/threonine-protein kinase/ATP-binding protein/sensor histidine kinase n=1 Tax=Calothrix sp. NIES-2100 TaxID=1954172 RepID=UPI000B5F488D|nr:multi-sensor signal transduction multi-kinase [Calothrix sp. NIES-2100]